jgi:hypothetical protein
MNLRTLYRQLDALVDQGIQLVGKRTQLGNVFLPGSVFGGKQIDGFSFEDIVIGEDAVLLRLDPVYAIGKLGNCRQGSAKEATRIGAVNTVMQEIRGVIRIVVNIEAGCAKVRSHDLSHIDKVSVRVIINVHTSDRLHGMMVGIAA